jgi:mono/diheme cytochrome c family protein
VRRPQLGRWEWLPIVLWLACGAAGVAAPQESAAADYESVLRFVRDGETLKVIGLDSLRSQCGGARVAVSDPYYARAKSFYACPLSTVLARGFGASEEDLRAETFLLRARDGYTRPESGARLLEGGAQLAFADADLSGEAGAAFSREGAGGSFAPVWEPIDRRQVDPGPFYLIWSGAHQNDPHRYPWPYQLATIEIGSFERAFPHMLPLGASEDSAAVSGFSVFRAECMACHSINGEGGKVGPDLNIPQSIVEYRPPEQIKRFIRDPASFRYTSMPAHPHLEAQQLDSLVAYFEWMKGLKHDPNVAAGPP